MSSGAPLACSQKYRRVKPEGGVLLAAYLLLRFFAFNQKWVNLCWPLSICIFPLFVQLFVCDFVTLQSAKQEFGESTALHFSVDDYFSVILFLKQFFSWNIFSIKGTSDLEILSRTLF